MTVLIPPTRSLSSLQSTALSPGKKVVLIASASMGSPAGVPVPVSLISQSSPIRKSFHWVFISYHVPRSTEVVDWDQLDLVQHEYSNLASTEPVLWRSASSICKPSIIQVGFRVTHIVIPGVFPS